MIFTSNFQHQRPGFAGIQRRTSTGKTEKFAVSFRKRNQCVEVAGIISWKMTNAQKSATSYGAAGAAVNALPSGATISLK